MEGIVLQKCTPIHHFSQLTSSLPEIMYLKKHQTAAKQTIFKTQILLKPYFLHNHWLSTVELS